MGSDAIRPVLGCAYIQQGRCSLISPFVVRSLEIIISKVATSEISIFKLVSVAEQSSLSCTWLETPKTGFLVLGPICLLAS